jgi:hypothetical protein
MHPGDLTPIPAIIAFDLERERKEGGMEQKTQVDHGVKR